MATINRSRAPTRSCLLNYFIPAIPNYYISGLYDRYTARKRRRAFVCVSRARCALFLRFSTTIKEDYGKGVKTSPRYSRQRVFLIIREISFVWRVAAARWNAKNIFVYGALCDNNERVPKNIKLEKPARGFSPWFTLKHRYPNCRRNEISQSLYLRNIYNCLLFVTNYSIHALPSVTYFPNDSRRRT